MRVFPPARRLKKYAALVLVVTLVKIPWVMKMREDGAALLSGAANDDLLARRRYLVDRVYGESAGTSSMPWHLPAQFQGEWAVGTYSMLSMALANISFVAPETREESLRVVGALIERMQSDELREFDRARWGEDPLESMGGTNGHIGYLAHLNLMLGAYRFMGGDDRFEALYERVSSALAARLRARPGLCLETYPGETYVPDNLAVLASLANRSRLDGGTHAELVHEWVCHARSSLLDNETGLLPFHLDGACAPVPGGRGSGSGWNSFYLPMIDEDLAAEQWKRLLSTFLQRGLVTGIREYPRSVFGIGDVDSGPVIFGLSPSGTGFSIAGAVHAGDAALVSELLRTAEIVGSSFEWNGKRRYLLAPLVGDAIILAMKTSRVWDERFIAR